MFQESGFGEYEDRINPRAQDKNSIEVPKIEEVKETEGTVGNPDVLADMPAKPESYPTVDLNEKQKKDLRETIQKIKDRPSEEYDD